MSLLDVSEDQIQHLSPEALTDLLRRLLVLEARTAGVPVRQVGGTVKLNIGDGGLDCSIDWDLEPGVPPTRPKWLPSNLVAFQVKAGKCQPKKWETEVLQKPKLGSTRKIPQIKPGILAILKRGGAYVGFCNEPLNDKLKKDRIEAVYRSLRASRSGLAKARVLMLGSAEIAQWANEHISAVAFVHHRTKNFDLSFMQTWDEWESESDLLLKYHEDESREKIRKELESRLFEPKYSARVIGLSGLGKSRLALEICRSRSEDVAYIPKGAHLKDAGALFRALVRDHRAGVIVVDECPLAMHNELQQIISGTESELSILTLDFDPDSIPRSGDWFHIRPLAFLAIRDLIIEMGAHLDAVQISNLAQWSQGFPEMARLLLDAIKKDRAIWSLGDQELFEKITSPRRPLSDEQRQCLIGLSAAGMIYASDKSDSLAMFAQDFCGISTTSARRTLLALEKRQIVESRNDYFFVTPLPLALHLAANWWSTNDHTARAILTQHRYSEMWHSFANQMLYLNKHETVRTEVSHALMSADQRLREIWFSSSGYRLVQCFAKINPGATQRLVQEWIRDLEWPACLSHTNDFSTLAVVLRRLAWYPLHFEFAASRLLEIAAAGNNDARKDFVQLFALYRSGTSTPARARVPVLVASVSAGQGDKIGIVVDALIFALKQENSGDLQFDDWNLDSTPDWQPERGSEIREYWASCADIMLALLSDHRFTVKIQREFAMRAPELIRNGALDVVEEAVARHKHRVPGVWVDLRNNLATTLLWKALPDKIGVRVRALRDTLAPTDLVQQVHETVTRDNSDSSIASTRAGFSSLADEKAYLLGQELGNEQERLDSVLDSVLSGRQRAAHEFGLGVASVLSDVSTLISQCMERLRRLPDAEPSFVFGLLREGRHATVVDGFVRSATDDPLLRLHFPRIVVSAGSKPQHVKLLQDAISEGRIKVDHSNEFMIMLALFRSDGGIILDFLEVLLNASGAGAVLYVFHGFKVNRRPVEPFVSYVRDISSREGIVEDMLKQQEHLIGILAGMVKSELASSSDAEDFATLLIEKIGDVWAKPKKRGSDDGLELRTINSAPIIEVILAWDHDRGWKLLFSLLGRNDSRVWRRLIRVCRNVYLRNSPDPESVFDRHREEIIAWAGVEVERGLALAQSASLIDYRNERQWSGVARFLLDLFGQDERVRQAFDNSRSSRSWSGSAIPIYSNDLEAYRALLDHSFDIVRSWAAQRVANLEDQIKYFSQEEKKFG